MEFLPSIGEIAAELKIRPKKPFRGGSRADIATDEWKNLTEGLLSSAMGNAEFSHHAYGNYCVRFYIENSPVWVTCYALGFANPQRRVYGLFLSYPNYREGGKGKINNIATLEDIKGILRKDARQVRTKIADIALAGDEGFPEKSLAASPERQFESDSEAMEWLSGYVDKIASHLVPLIKRANEI